MPQGESAAALIVTTCLARAKSNGRLAVPEPGTPPSLTYLALEAAATKVAQLEVRPSVPLAAEHRSMRPVTRLHAQGDEAMAAFAAEWEGLDEVKGTRAALEKERAAAEKAAAAEAKAKAKGKKKK